MKFPAIVLLVLLALPGCDGPKQRAGELKDKVAAQDKGESYAGEGPNERMGKAGDRADEAEQQAKDATADALRKQGEAARRQADVPAGRLDEQARAIREDADKRGNVMDTEANARQK